MTRQVLVQDTTIESLLEQINSSIETTIELVLDRKSKQPILDKYKLGSRSTRFKTDEVRTLLKLIERKRN